MAQRFEDLVAWQRGRSLVAEVYRITRRPPLSHDAGLTRQMRRSAVSITSNIAEGFERGRAAEFHQLLSVAKGPCGELRSQTYNTRVVGHLDDQTFHTLLQQVEETGSIIGGLRASVERRKATW